MARIDDENEAMAQIRMSVNAHDQARQDGDDDDDSSSESESSHPDSQSQPSSNASHLALHWTLSVKQRATTAGLLMDEYRQSKDQRFRRFVPELRELIVHHFPDEGVTTNEDVGILQVSYIANHYCGLRC